MLPADPRIVFQVTGVVLGALILWVIFVNVRLPTRAVMGPEIVKKVPPPAEEDTEEDAEEERDEK